MFESLNQFLASDGFMPDHWFSGGVKVVTAIASLGTAVLLVPLLPPRSP